MMKLFHYFVDEAALFKKAKEIHRNSLIVDSHCDTPMKFTEGFNFGERHEDVKVDLPKMQEGREDAIFMVAYLHQDARNDESLQAATQKAVDIFYQISEQVKLNESRVGIAYNVDDLIYLKMPGRKPSSLPSKTGMPSAKTSTIFPCSKTWGSRTSRYAITGAMIFVIPPRVSRNMTD